MCIVIYTDTATENTTKEVDFTMAYQGAIANFSRKQLYEQLQSDIQSIINSVNNAKNENDISVAIHVALIMSSNYHQNMDYKEVHKYLEGIIDILYPLILHNAVIQDLIKALNELMDAIKKILTEESNNETTIDPATKEVNSTMENQYNEVRQPTRKELYEQLHKNVQFTIEAIKGAKTEEEINAALHKAEETFTHYRNTSDYKEVYNFFGDITGTITQVMLHNAVRQDLIKVLEALMAFINNILEEEKQAELIKRVRAFFNECADNAEKIVNIIDMYKIFG